MDPADRERIVNYRPLAVAALGFTLGLSAFERLYGRGSVYGAVLAALAAAAIVLFTVGFLKKKRWVCLLAIAFSAGICRMLLALPDSVAPGEYAAEGTVAEASPDAQGKVVLKNVSLNGSPMRYGLKLTLAEDAPAPSVGQRISCVCTVREPTVRFASYNERQTLLARGISAVARADSYTVTGEGRLRSSAALYRVKAFLRLRIHEAFQDNGAVVAGFLLGDKSGMDEADVDAFRAAGTAHLLSLSGFHVGLLTAALFLLLPKRFPKLRAAAAGLFLVGYCAISAFAPSLVRASVMCACVLAADVFERRADPLSSLSLSALIILAVRPYELFSVGFRLSYAATLGIVFVLRHGAPGPRRGLLGKLINGACVAVAATAATALISARHFGVFPTYGIAANIAAVPLFSAAIVLCFAGLLLGMVFPPLAYAFARPGDILTGLAMRSLGFIGSLPHALVEVNAPSVLTGVLMLVLMFGISGFVLRPIGKRLKIAAVLFVLFTMSAAADIILV
ncbi:MAG: ComEC/Rec2 family competence protein [Clostridia bacterium]|nr:ComEC/Rec2 family competence protein [Clostridia bacterium]